MAEVCRLKAAYHLRYPALLLRRCLYTSAQADSATQPNSIASTSTPSIAPKVQIDLKHIRENPDLHEQNCINRNYTALAQHPRKIVQLFDKWKALQFEARSSRERNNGILRELKAGDKVDGNVRKELLDEAARLKAQISAIEQEEKSLNGKISELAIELPNLTSEHTPIGDQPEVLEYINEHPDANEKERSTASHVSIGAELDLLDFAAAGSTSGWGFYYLKNEAALLEQALIQYAIKTAMDNGFHIVTPPSMVYSHISSACGFRPRDSGGEQQIYPIAQSVDDNLKPELCLAGTAEIPFAAMKASTDVEANQLPLHLVGASRCYRAEAGSRGIDTKGLYRVHEFTKVEMFGWTTAGSEQKLFDCMISVQKQVLKSLGLHCRLLEQPSHDLGASATRKQDIEAFFPSRRQRNDGWGELTSTSICTDYQTRRLATRVRSNGNFDFPYTVNGTALAVPRVIAAILENHWDEDKKVVHLPKILWPWMGGLQTIGPRASS